MFCIFVFFGHFTNIFRFCRIFPQKSKPNFRKSYHIYGKIVYGIFFVLFLAINQNKPRPNNINSMGTVIFCSIKGGARRFILEYRYRVDNWPKIYNGYPNF